MERDDRVFEAVCLQGCVTFGEILRLAICKVQAYEGRPIHLTLLLGLGLLLCGCLLHALGAQTHVPGVGTLQTELVVRAALL